MGRERAGLSALPTAPLPARPPAPGCPHLVHSVEDGLVELLPRVGRESVVRPIGVAQQEEVAEGNGVLLPKRHCQLVAEPEQDELVGGAGTDKAGHEECPP